MIKRWFKPTAVVWTLAALIAGFAPLPAHAQEERSRERETRERREREAKSNENGRLGRDGDSLGRDDGKITRDSERISRDSDRLTKDRDTRDSERLNKADDNLAKNDKTTRSDEVRQQEVRDRLRENNRVGNEWERKTDQYLRDREKVDPHDQVTIQSADGTRSRADMIYQRSDGKYVLVECKASETADYTKNQKEVYKRINAGEEVTIRGDNMGPEMRDRKVKIDEIYVSRPDANGDVRLQRYPSAEVRAAAQ